MIRTRAQVLWEQAAHYDALQREIDAIYADADASLAWATEYLRRPDVRRTLPGYNKFEDEIS